MLRMLKHNQTTKQNNYMPVNKVLIADDNSANIDVFFAFFEKLPVEYEVLYASNGKLAYDIAIVEIPDLIIMDWEMPVMNGIEATNLLRTNPLTKDIPVIIATGIMTSSQDLEIALEAGAYDYVRKPIDEVELRARMNSALALAASYARIKQQNDEIQTLYEKEKKWMEAEIDHKQRELATSAMFLSQKNEILIDLDKKLERFAEGMDIHQLRKLKEIRHLIKDNLRVDDSWDSFKIHFEKVHPSFFNHLETEYPHLTLNDLKLCAYTHIGMANKEVAQLLHISVESVKKAKQRLKKKLNLTDAPLLQFLKAIVT